ncbi:MAG: divalent-cation tolerance protein CutA [Pirellulales bacterium]|nr:divalent-cation tolerance protein CutA [Pirellulales bacterium]
MATEFCVLTTAPTAAEADAIAAALVERRLAACVQIVGPVASVYRWQGRVERAEERLLVVKTTAAAYPQVEAAIRALHSYQCPEIVALPIVAGSDDYLGWLRGEIGEG